MKYSKTITALVLTVGLAGLIGGCSTSPEYKKTFDKASTMSYDECMENSSVRKHYSSWLNRNAFCKLNTVDRRI